MTCRDNLIAPDRRRFDQQIIHLTLAKNFKVGIGFIQQHHRAWVGVHVRKNQQRLLQSTSAGRKIKPDPVFPIAHGNFPPLFNVPRFLKFSAEERPDLIHQRLPLIGSFSKNTGTQVPQHLCRSALAHPDVDRALVQSRFRRGKTGHRGKVSHVHRPSLGWNRHAVRRFIFTRSEWSAVERLLVRVVEFQAAAPLLARRDSLHDHVDSDVVRPLAPFDFTHVPRVKLTPQQRSVRNGNGQKVSAVDSHSGTLLRRPLSRAPFVPAFQSDLPKCQRLHG